MLHFHEGTLRVIAYYTQPDLVHSAGGPYIALIAKLINKEFAGTQLYRERVFFFYPLSANFVPAQPVWIP
jgi:hypothetical protein